MSTRIVLLRHGRSAHVAGGWLDADALRRWFVDYDLAALAHDERPPERARALAREVACVVASDMPRARASAALLLPDGPVRESPLLREVPMPIPTWPGVRLPLVGWALATGMRAAVSRLRRLPPPEAVRQQAEAAAAWLGELAQAHGSVLAVTHAGVRAQITRVLREQGWVAAVEGGSYRQGGSYAHWSAWTLTRGD
jgi:broad specificity phosphatase PhoE